MLQGEVKESPVAGIDTLPDEALQHVLGFLPAQEAVRTCALARRWRHLWRSVSALRVTSTDFGAEHEFTALNKFVKNLLRLRDPKAPLDFCEFLVTLLGDFYADYDEYELPKISSWIAQALLYHARILKVHYNDMDAHYLINLGDLHFISQHLTTMELKSVQVTGDFSSCLVLKNLRMICCDVISDKLLCQSVRQLTIIECMFLSGKRTRISAPSVVWLELSDGYHRTPLLENMPSLVNAFIRLSFPDDCCGKEFGNSCYNISCENCADNSDAIMDCVVLKGLSNAESLELIAVPSMAVSGFWEILGGNGIYEPLEKWRFPILAAQTNREVGLDHEMEPGHAYPSAETLTTSAITGPPCPPPNGDECYCCIS